MEKCGWWVECGVTSLAAALAIAMAMPREALKAMGARGRAWMKRDFSWDAVAVKMIDLYGWLISGARLGSPISSIWIDRAEARVGAASCASSAAIKPSFQALR
jgi:hypothetical protein